MKKIRVFTTLYKMAKDRHRPGYYTEYNLKHPERLKRIGINIENKEENKQYGG